MHELMIYGANGYTGRLVVQKALALGLSPLLAGRNGEALRALGARSGLSTRVFALDAPAALDALLEGVRVLLNCAGPFSATAAPLIQACLRQRVHYLDITGEIEVFALAHRLDAAAREAGIVLLPGTGFDVVPSDCLVVKLARELPDASSLLLAFDGEGGPSPGTALTAIEGLASGGRVRREGRLIRVPLAWKQRLVDFDHGRRHVVSIPWGDVYTAYLSTGIPNIEVYMAMSPRRIRQLRRLRLLRPLLALRPLQQLLKARVARSVRGPDEQTLASSRSHFWAEVANPAGELRSMRMSTPNGYVLTAEASLRIAAQVLSRDGPAGYHTPSQYLGPDFIDTLPGVVIEP